MVDKPIKEIDTQIKDYEYMKKQEKREAIQQYYDEVVDDLLQLLPLDKIFKDKWLNTSTSMASIKKEINEAIEKVRNDLLVIGSYESEFVPMMRAHYLEHLDLSAAIQEAKRLEEIKKADAQQHPKEETPPVVETVVENVIPDPGQIYTLAFEVSGTKTDLLALSNYLKVNKFNYRRLK